MALVTPKRMRAVYGMLSQFPPFNRWSLPAPDRVRFYLISELKDEGGYNESDGRHEIGVNPDLVHTMERLVRTVAHEMAHMKQEINGRRPGSKDEQHNREFHRLKRIICRDLGFDTELF